MQKNHFLLFEKIKKYRKCPALESGFFFVLLQDTPEQWGLDLDCLSTTWQCVALQKKGGAAPKKDYRTIKVAWLTMNGIVKGRVI